MVERGQGCRGAAAQPGYERRAGLERHGEVVELQERGRHGAATFSTSGWMHAVA